MNVIHRGYFADLINQLNLKIAVEIGVRYGWYSRWLLDNSNLDKLYAIDPWTFNDVNGEPEITYEAAKNNLLIHGERVEIIRGLAEEEVSRFSDSFFDFIYIDALHHYNAVSRDINQWWPKLKNGGIIAGHDFSSDWPGVMRAVKEFSQQNKLQLFITGVGDNYGETDYSQPSWFFKK